MDPPGKLDSAHSHCYINRRVANARQVLQQWVNADYSHEEFFSAWLDK